jgi:acyl-CoA thioesterase I
MLELPLLPLHKDFGVAQRELAAKYGVTLVPKYLFAGVLGADGATTDGIHLSPSGHEAMAKMVGRMIEIEPVK